MLGYGSFLDNLYLFLLVFGEKWYKGLEVGVIEGVMYDICCK